MRKPPLGKPTELGRRSLEPAPNYQASRLRMKVRSLLSTTRELCRVRDLNKSATQALPLREPQLCPKQMVMICSCCCQGHTTQAWPTAGAQSDALAQVVRMARVMGQDGETVCVSAEGRGGRVQEGLKKDWW